MKIIAAIFLNHLSKVWILPITVPSFVALYTRINEKTTHPLAFFDFSNRNIFIYLHIPICAMNEKIKLLNALSDETRIKIVQSLMGGEQCACSIFPIVGKAQSTVSQHLKTLEEAGVLESRRESVNIWYKIKSKETIQIMKILGISKVESKIKC